MLLLYGGRWCGAVFHGWPPIRAHSLALIWYSPAVPPLLSSVQACGFQPDSELTSATTHAAGSAGHLAVASSITGSIFLASGGSAPTLRSVACQVLGADSLARKPGPPLYTSLTVSGFCTFTPTRTTPWLSVVSCVSGFQPLPSCCTAVTGAPATEWPLAISRP